MRDFAHSYLFLRRFIGFIGTLLPFAVIIGVALLSGELLTSVSASYHTGMRDVFVGSMCAIGVFLIFYRGLDWRDDVLGWIAGLAAIGVATVPTRPPKDATSMQVLAGYVHIGLSAVFFLALAVFCFRFTHKEQDPPPDPQRKQLRNRVYITCGVVILACLALIALFGWVLETWAAPAHPVLWLEAVATVAFGWSWFIKGQTLWKDNPPAIPAPAPPGDDAQPPATAETAPV